MITTYFKCVTGQERDWEHLSVLLSIIIDKINILSFLCFVQLGQTKRSQTVELAVSDLINDLVSDLVSDWILVLLCRKTVQNILTLCQLVVEHPCIFYLILDKLYVLFDENGMSRYIIGNRWLNIHLGLPPMYLWRLFDTWLHIF